MGSQELDRDRRREEFVRLFQRYERSLFGYILSLVPSIAAADDISQNTNLLLWEEFGKFDSSKDFGAWARTIARYEVLRYRKTNNRERLRFDSELVEALASRAAMRCDELAARQDYLIDCMAQLSEYKRHVIKLYYFLGMTAKSVAERLGRNAAAIEKTILRTRRMLYDCVEAAAHREERL